MTSWGTRQYGNSAHAGGSLSPLATTICFGGSIGLFLICGFLAKDIFISDDSGLTPPLALVAYNESGGTQKGTKTPAHILSVRETYKPQLDENGKRVATIETGPAKSATLTPPPNARPVQDIETVPVTKPSPPAPAPSASKAEKFTNKTPETASKPVTVKVAETKKPNPPVGLSQVTPQNESRGVITMGASKTKSAAFEPIPFSSDMSAQVKSSSNASVASQPETKTAAIQAQPPRKTEPKAKQSQKPKKEKTLKEPEKTAKTDSPAKKPEPVAVPATGDPSMAGVIAFMKKSAGSTDKTKIRQYIRTVSVLKQCGRSQKKAKKAYEKNNKRAYLRLIEFENRRIDMAMKSARRNGQSNVNASDFTLNMSSGTHNPNLASGKRFQKMEAAFTDDFYPQTPSKQTCDTLGQQAKSGAFDIKL